MTTSTADAPVHKDFSKEYIGPTQTHTRQYVACEVRMDKSFPWVPSVMQAPRTMATVGRRTFGSSNSNTSSLLLETNWIWFKFDNRDRLVELNVAVSLPEQGVTSTPNGDYHSSYCSSEVGRIFISQ